MTSLWTTGSNEGHHCVEDETFTWCSSRVTVSNQTRNGSDVIAKMANRNSTSDRCISMNFATSSFAFTNCDLEHQFICEVP
jgi:hypothetical protein